jgi:hypothetical protein
MSDFEDEPCLLGSYPHRTLLHFAIHHGITDNFASHKFYFLAKVWAEFLHKLDDDDETYMSIDSYQDSFDIFADTQPESPPSKIRRIWDFTN